MKNHQVKLAGLGISPPLIPSHNQNYLRKRETRTIHFWPTPGNSDPYMCHAVWYPFAICGFLHLNEWKWNKIINSVPQLRQPHFTRSATTLGGAAKLPEGGTCFTDQIHVCQQIYAEGINSVSQWDCVRLIHDQTPSQISSASRRPGWVGNGNFTTILLLSITFSHY